MFKINTVKVIVWDLDGTLFYSPETASDIRSIFIQIYRNSKKISQTAAEKNFTTLSMKYNWSYAVSKLTGLPEKNVLFKLEAKLNRTKYARFDSKLISMFKKLKKFRHIILTNATYVNTVGVLQSLGFPIKTGGSIKPFEKIFTLDRVTQPKPHHSAFMHILNHTKLPPDNHLMVGDFLESDIAPAKKLNFKTCLIGFNSGADYNLKSVYEIPALFSTLFKLSLVLKNLKRFSLMLE